MQDTGKKEDTEGMNPDIALKILRMILCNDEVKTWLKQAASESNTPIDDWALDIVVLLLCGSD